MALVLIAIGGLAVATAQGQSSTLIVDGDDDGDEHYATIQAAVDDAAPGDTIELQPGTYHPQLLIRTSVTIRAPDGAHLEGSKFGGVKRAMVVYENTVISGVTISGYTQGIVAAGAERLSVRNSVIRNGDGDVTYGMEGGGDTALRLWNVTIADQTNGINAFDRGRLQYSEIRNITNVGINAYRSTADWILENTTITDSPGAAVSARRSGGNWTIRESTIRVTHFGVNAELSRGDWRIVNASIIVEGAESDGGFAVRAIRTTGEWEIHGSTLTSSSDTALDATYADAEGDATRNWWGQASGPQDACVGNVDCSDHLASAPESGADQSPPSTPTPTPTPTPTTTPTLTTTPTSTPTVSDSGTSAASATPTATRTDGPSGTTTPSPVAGQTTRSTSDQERTTDRGGPGFGVLATLVGLAWTVMWARSRT